MRAGKLIMAMALSVLIMSCGAGRSKAGGNNNDTMTDISGQEAASRVPEFSADSAFLYLKRQVEFGPRVPGSEAHVRTADWLCGELRRHGAEVMEQKAELKAFDGTVLKCRNIFGSFNPEKKERLLLLAHYDTRPWADKDPDPANHGKPIDGANDGASGVAVLLETARVIGERTPGQGIDILFVDCEDYGDEGDEDSWALGADYFARNPIYPGYRPEKAILLDMVGAREARFPAEYFSREAAPELDDAFRAAAAAAGYGSMFPLVMGGGVTDDHQKLIEQGIPAIDIIDYRDTGFCPQWHTMADNIDNIDPAVLKAVGQSLVHYLYTVNN